MIDNSLGLNHSIVIALVVGIEIAAPIPNIIRSKIIMGKEFTKGSNRPADIKLPLKIIAFLEPIFEIKKPPGKRNKAMTSVTEEITNPTIPLLMP